MPVVLAVGSGAIVFDKRLSLRNSASCGVSYIWKMSRQSYFGFVPFAKPTVCYSDERVTRILFYPVGISIPHCR